jgi:hypothetical protein
MSGDKDKISGKMLSHLRKTERALKWSSFIFEALFLVEIEGGKIRNFPTNEGQ